MQAHYATFIDETPGRGGPTGHAYATVPGEWTGRHLNRAPLETDVIWFWARVPQIPTTLSMLTPEYQQWEVQERFCQGNSGVDQWPSQFGWLDGLMRRLHRPLGRDHMIIATP